MFPNSPLSEHPIIFRQVFLSSPSKNDLLMNFGNQEQKNIQNVSAPSSIQSCQIKSRSLKKKISSFQISFQQTLLDEHWSSLQKQLRNYIELSIHPNQTHSLKELSVNLQPLTLKNHKHRYFHEYDLLSQLFFTEHGKIQFSKDLQGEEKLQEFLHLLPQYMSLELSTQLVYITYLVWERYLNFRKPLLKLKKLKEQASKFAQQMSDVLYSDRKIQYLNLQYLRDKLNMGEPDLRKHFQHFIQFYAETIFLIIQGYFENPYFDQEHSEHELSTIQCYSNPLEDSEEECERYQPLKMKKLN